ncbi:MAG: TetR/AcrR family transcriptional regulator [Alphaproteobacteria bacterium]|nr:TetR/AcrR family transcriptional regulator [Alphaproteobacteria bacterium]
MAKKPQKRPAKKATKRAAKSQTSKSPTGRRVQPEERILDAALKLAAERGWAGLGMGDIAAAAGQKLSDVRALYPSKSALLTAYLARVDRLVLQSLEQDADLAGETPRDRLFDILMRRIDALTAHKEGIIAIARDAPRDPLSVLCVMPQGLASMEWMLAGAGISVSGPKGRLAARALGVAWGATVRTWFSDDDADLARTMAMLDRQLGRLERAAELCGGRRHRKAA